MFRHGSLFGALVLGLGLGRAQAPVPVGALDHGAALRTVAHNAFRPGEKLTYVVHYGLMDAGEAVLELQESDLRMEGRPLLHAKGVGRSLGAFNLFYKVDDRYDTWFDRDGVFPWIFKRSVNEGGYTFTQDYVYLQHKQVVTTQKQRTHTVPLHVQDMLSAFYYARTLDLSNVAPGQEFTIPCFLDDELWPLRMRYVGRETIRIRNGRYRCLKFQPVVQEGRIFATNDDLNVWITDDGNRIPVLAKAKVLVGSIKMELSGHEGLVHPLARVE
ncbi:MAG: DUF3108 domain-containing protein [Flavobacteriales bacterium]|nr:hypothetical protein [Flavobacteriales bacterium]MCC6578222.1 DUF3108 domain-containing protein [Flavobacteriales bacterium]NUQ14335.1 DUF3108 domain-containing protein [Flavobacteriales bacterium]